MTRHRERLVLPVGSWVDLECVNVSAVLWSPDPLEEDIECDRKLGRVRLTTGRHNREFWDVEYDAPDVADVAAERARLTAEVQIEAAETQDIIDPSKLAAMKANLDAIKLYTAASTAAQRDTDMIGMLKNLERIVRRLLAREARRSGTSL